MGKLTVGIKAIQSLFVKLAFSPKDTSHVVEMVKIGGTNYLVPRALEMLHNYAGMGCGRDPKDLDMAIQLLALARVLNHEPEEVPKRDRARKDNPVADNRSS